jgi:hypothetical protein
MACYALGGIVLPTVAFDGPAEVESAAGRNATELQGRVQAIFDTLYWTYPASRHRLAWTLMRWLLLWSMEDLGGMSIVRIFGIESCSAQLCFLCGIYCRIYYFKLCDLFQDESGGSWRDKVIREICWKPMVLHL